MKEQTGFLGTRTGLARKTSRVILMSITPLALVLVTPSLAGAVSTCAPMWSPNNYAMGIASTANAYGIEGYISVNSPSVPTAYQTIDAHIFSLSSTGASGLEVGWDIGEEWGDGGVAYGYTTVPALFSTNFNASNYVALNGPTISNGSDYYYAVWWNGSSTLTFRVNTYADSPTIIWNGGFGLTRNVGTYGAGSEYAPGNYSLSGLHSGSTTIQPTLYLNPSSSWVSAGFSTVCADTGLTISVNGNSVTVGGTLN